MMIDPRKVEDPGEEVAQELKDRACAASTVGAPVLNLVQRA